MVGFYKAVLVLAVLAFSSPAHAVRLISQDVKVTATLPAVQPDWPVPTEPNQIFYIQRSLNSNTIVYAARYDDNGNLRKKGSIFWRRYNDAGQRKALKAYEYLAFGVKLLPSDAPDSFGIKLRALPALKMTLRQTAPGQSEVITRLGGRDVRAVYAYVTVDESGVIPKVTELRMHGIDLETGKAVSEHFQVQGGSFRY